MELWVDFALSLAAAVAWTVTAATSLRSIRFKRPTTREAQLAGLVALLGLTWLLTVSSLAKPGVIPPEWPKVLTLAARWLLVVTGLWALIAQRYRRHE